MEYLHLFKTKTEHDSFYNGNKYKEPWLAYIRDNTLVTSNRTYEYYRNEYLTLSALGDGNITITIPSDVNATHATSLSYSKDKSNWTDTIVDNTVKTISIPIKSGDDVYLKGDALMWFNEARYIGLSINSTANINASGNIMSLLYGDNFTDKTTFSKGSNYIFALLFVNNTHLINAENLVLPATTLASYCYSNMFEGCTSLTTAPKLQATTLATYCYSNMFYGCKSLTAAPELPATTLAENCYEYMFNGCTSLTTAPELPATTLAENCYSSMFYDCETLTTASELQSITLTYNCYSSMFSGCTSLTTAPALPATTLADSCYSSMFSGCTSLEVAPKLPATTLAPGCYQFMFNKCTSLTTAPKLPATALVNSCYFGMFRSCSSLNSITMLATDISASGCLTNWVYGVASTGIFVKADSMSSLPTGDSGIPTGWTVVNK